MSIASLNQFQNEVMQDSALQEQLKTAAATSPESLGELALKLGAERGYSFTLEEIQATIKATSSKPSVAEELTDEELEIVSGGDAFWWEMRFQVEEIERAERLVIGTVGQIGDMTSRAL